MTQPALHHRRQRLAAVLGARGLLQHRERLEQRGPVGARLVTVGEQRALRH